MLPSIEEAAELLDDFDALWKEATPEERRKLVGPLIERVYIDLTDKRICGITPRPGFAELVRSAVQKATHHACVLLTQEEVQQYANVGMVETGEGRTIP